MTDPIIIQTTTVHLTDQEVQFLVACQKYHEQIKTLLASNVFELRKGKVIISFNADGVITDVQGDISLYHRSYPQAPKP
jgi:hypothetical protein